MQKGPTPHAKTPNRYWLGVVSRDHVRRGVERGIAQIGHGKKAGLQRMSAGDWLVYYSPRAGIREGEAVQALTAIGELPDDEVWQADEGDFKPWRRRVSYWAGAREVPIAELKHQLELTAGPNWGYSLRRGLVELSARDFELIEKAMRPRSADPSGRRGIESRFSGPETSPGFLLWQVSNRWQAAQRLALEPLGLTHVRFVLLASLAWLESEEPITQRRLAEHAALDVMMTSQVLRALERDGLIERLVHPSDARARALRTTRQGRALARRAIAVVERCDEDFFAPLGSEPDELTRELSTLAAAAAVSASAT